MGQEITVGANIPDVSLKIMGDNGMEVISTAALFAGKTSLLFAVPGAFTPTCSQKHLPGYVNNFEQLKAKGIEQVICLSVNDPFVMQEWAKQGGADGKIVMLADGNATFTESLGLAFDSSAHGMGKRARRFAMVVKNGVVTDLQIEAPGSFEVSGADPMICRL
ncbi:MAG: peroxiredoxin [Alphaproteobacteria bacterium]